YAALGQEARSQIDPDLVAADKKRRQRPQDKAHDREHDDELYEREAAFTREPGERPTSTEMHVCNPGNEPPNASVPVSTPPMTERILLLLRRLDGVHGKHVELHGRGIGPNG